MTPYLLDLQLHRDARGALISLESAGAAALPFMVQRVFFIFDVPVNQSRGEHPVICRELIVALQGSCEVATVQDGVARDFELSTPTQALYIPEGVWVRLHRFSPGTLVAVAADQPYSPRLPATGFGV